MLAKPTQEWRQSWSRRLRRILKQARFFWVWAFWHEVSRNLHDSSFHSHPWEDSPFCRPRILLFCCPFAGRPVEAPAIPENTTSRLQKISEEELYQICRVIRSMDCFDQFIRWMLAEQSVETTYRFLFGTSRRDPKEDVNDFIQFQKKVKKIEWNPLQALGAVLQFSTLRESFCSLVGFKSRKTKPSLLVLMSWLWDALGII